MSFQNVNVSQYTSEKKCHRLFYLTDRKYAVDGIFKNATGQP